MSIEVRDLGRMAYAQALALQRSAVEEVVRRRSAGGEANGGGVAGETGEVIFLVEHDPPVITVSRRPGSRQHLLATDAQLAAAGVTVAETDRGGDITYHGPGQLVAYPILDLNRLGLRIHGYMRLLEQAVIDTLAEFGMAGERDASATGVWVKARGAAAQAIGGTSASVVTSHASSKVCAMGVRVSRWVSMHGLALNVTTNLDHFNLIVPCGLVGRGVTSMERELGSKRPAMAAVKQAFVSHLLKHIGPAVRATKESRSHQRVG